MLGCFTPNFQNSGALCFLYSCRAPNGECNDMKTEHEKVEEQPRSCSSTESLFKPGPESIKTKCLHCDRIISTQTQPESSMQTHIVAVMLFPFCCCIPYYFSCCKNIHHYCPSCGQYLETFRR